MQLDSKKYTKLIVKAYEEKRDANLLSHLLINPSTASIRQECLNVYTEKTRNGEQEEEYTLRSFFGVLPPGKNFGKVIEKYELDRFRPLQGLINGKIKNPTLANVELLAWLIDFTPRPLSRAQKAFENPYTRASLVSPITGGDEGNAKPNQIDTNAVEIKEVLSTTNAGNTESLREDEDNKTAIKNSEGVTNIQAKNPGGNVKNKKLRIAAAIALILTILFGGIYIIGQQERSPKMPFGNVGTGCMYWSNDHYEQVACNEEPKGRLILPLNEEKMKNFKKITMEDTITEKSIGVIYYLKNEGKIEYFTTGGNHPVYVTRPLKVLSPYMFDEHLREKKVIGKDSLAEQKTKFINNK